MNRSYNDIVEEKIEDAKINSGIKKPEYWIKQRSADRVIFWDTYLHKGCYYITETESNPFNK